MPEIFTNYYDPKQECNDNAQVYKPLWDGMTFLGYHVVRSDPKL